MPAPSRPGSYPPGHVLRIHLDKDPADPAQWAGIFKALEADKLGTEAPRWLCEEAMVKHEPAILHVTTHGVVAWRGLFDSLRRLRGPCRRSLRRQP